MSDVERIEINKEIERLKSKKDVYFSKYVYHSNEAKYLMQRYLNCIELIDNFENILKEIKDD